MCSFKDIVATHKIPSDWEKLLVLIQLNSIKLLISPFRQLEKSNDANMLNQTIFNNCLVKEAI